VCDLKIIFGTIKNGQYGAQWVETLKTNEAIVLLGKNLIISYLWPSDSNYLGIKKLVDYLSGKQDQEITLWLKLLENDLQNPRQNKEAAEELEKLYKRLVAEHNNGYSNFWIEAEMTDFTEK